VLDAAPPAAVAPVGEPGQKRKKRRKGLRGGVLIVLAIALIVSGAALFAAEPLTHQLPAPTVSVALPDTVTIPGPPPVLPWPAAGQAAVDIDGIGHLGTSGAKTPTPIASVTKVMTAYVILTSHPLQVGESGPSLTITAAQANDSTAAAARSESTVPVKAGAVFTERQALQALLLPSANNMARILGQWDAGSTDAFVAKMNATAEALGMTGSHYTDPAGFDPGTKSTAVDQVILGRKAIQLPAFAEIVAEPRATIPVAGQVANTNDLLGQNGIVGIKTGSTTEAGGCLLFAAKATVGGKSMLIVGAILTQPGNATPTQLNNVFKATSTLLKAVPAAVTEHTLIKAGKPIAVVQGPLGTGTTLTAAHDLDVLGWPGLAVKFTADVPPVPRALAAGAMHGSVSVTAGEAPAVKTDLHTTDQLAPPSWWERVKHHR
jgi:serine-type D-Ala-D-Ala carboxypeptidase (penicillin-binding protein 5/6)